MIRKAEERDLKRIVELSNKEESVFGMSELPFFAQFLDNITFLVYEREGQVIGFLNSVNQDYEYVHDGYNWAKKKFDKFNYVERLAVEKNLRRNGIAGQLYEYILSARQDSPVIAMIRINPPNIESLAFHNKRDFVKEGEIEYEPDELYGMFVLR